MHHVKEWDADLCLIAEPPRLADGPCLAKGLAAVWWNVRTVGPVKVRKRHEGLVAIQLKNVCMMSCYLPPNESLRRMIRRLDEMADWLRSAGLDTVVGGDFNAFSPLWGSRYANIRGDHVEIWAAGLDLRILNVGNTPTCIRPQGSSVVDLTWGTTGIVNVVSGWRVMSEIETLSDHGYVSFALNRVVAPSRDSLLLGWNWKKMDPDKFQAALIWSNASCELSLDNSSPDEYAEWVARSLRGAADCSTPRSRRPPGRKFAY